MGTSTSAALPPINLGDTVNFHLAGDPALAILAVDPSAGPMLNIGDPTTGGDPDFIVTAFDPGGDGTVKIALEWTSGDTVMVDDGTAPVANALMLGSGVPAQFLLTDTGEGVSMQVIAPEQLGYVGANGDAVPYTLICGRPAPDGSGLYSITVEP